MANPDSRKLLIKCLEDVYALEAHMVQTLGDHAKDARDIPEVRQKIEQHLRETELHRDRIEQRLHALGQSKPAMKSTLSNIMGQLLGATTGGRTLSVAKNTCDDYAAEHLEIGCYTELITLANTLGDQDTVRTAQLNLRDEMGMQQWLIQHLPEITIREMQREGIQVPANAAGASQNLFADLGLGGFGGQQPYGTVPQPPPPGPIPQPPPPVIS